MGLKGEKRTAMYQLSPDRKRYLLQQNRAYRSATPQSPSKPNPASYSASYGPSSAAALLPRLVPQLTGDALMRRFSVTGWGSGSISASSPVAEETIVSGEFDSLVRTKSLGSKTQMEKMVVEEEAKPIQPQTTGGLWSSWWASSGGEKSGDKIKETGKTAKWYVDGLKSTDMKLVKHLISLRVHLSTAKLIWIEEFVGNEKGLEALGGLLGGLVGKGGKRRSLTEMETTILLELVKCLRVLLNTQVSMGKPGLREIIHCSFSRLALQRSFRHPQSSLTSPIHCMYPHSSYAHWPRSFSRPYVSSLLRKDTKLFSPPYQTTESRMTNLFALKDSSLH